jgi:type IV secretory pathway TraG/TraD family ATPase VirD4
MTAVKGKLTAIIDAPKELLGQIAIMSLADNGWPPGLFNLLDEITVGKRKSQKTSGIGYDLDLSARISWQSHDNNRTKLTVSVTEREGHITVNDCKKECFTLIKGISDRAVNFSTALTRIQQRTTYGDARWATNNDLAEANYIVNSIDSSQLLLGPYEGNKFLALPPDETERHALVCGPTGCGKTSTMFVPNLLERTEWSAIVSEATAGTVETSNPEEVPTDGPDLMRKTAGYRAQQGHKIYYFNPDDLTSHRINPIEGITTIRQSSRLATLLIKNTNIRVDTTGDPFWETAETALLNSLIMHSAGNKGNLGEVRRLLRDGPKELARLLQNSNVGEAQARYEEFLHWSTENTRNSIVIGLMQRLELWTQPSIVALTEKNDINFNELQNELFTFYLSVPADKPELKPCASIIFTYLLNFVSAKRLKHRLSLYLDEFTNFGFITDFPNKLSIIRHRHIPALLGLQDYNQAEEIYKSTAATLFSQPATRIFFKPQTLAQAKIISESLGVENVYERSVSSNCQINEKEFGRDLMTPGAVQMLKKGRTIVFSPNTNPINLVRFEPQTYQEKSSIPPPPRRVLQVDDNLFRQCAESRKQQILPEAASGSATRAERPNQSSEPTRFQNKQPNEQFQFNQPTEQTSPPQNSDHTPSQDKQPTEPQYQQPTEPTQHTRTTEQSQHTPQSHPGQPYTDQSRAAEARTTQTSNQGHSAKTNETNAKKENQPNHPNFNEYGDRIPRF